MKKKILALCLVVVLAVTAVTGVTLAYFTDTDAQTNVFTTGNVKIDLFEDFGDNNDATIEKLMPATYDENGELKDNFIEKEVYVKNTGSEDAYVRVHIAIPDALDNGSTEFDASQNILHFNYTEDSIGEGKWDWSKTADDGKYEGNWNYYETYISNVKYNVYVVTYGTALTSGAVTVDAMSQVYLDKNVTNEVVTWLNNTLGNQWKIYVVAEGTQAEGFDDAYEALNTSFGTPGAADYKAPTFQAAAEGMTLVEMAPPISSEVVPLESLGE